MQLNAFLDKLLHNGSRLGEVAEHKTSLELQMFKLKIKCQTKNLTAILPNRC